MSAQTQQGISRPQVGHDTLPAPVTDALACFTESNLAGAVIASATLPIVLAEIVRENNWSFCPLTPDGFPLRFDFSSANNDLTHTSAICGPSTPAVRCLPKMAGLLDRLGGVPSAPVMVALTGLQTDGALDFGAWLRVRYDAAQPSYVVFAEVPQDATLRAEQPLLEVLGVQSLLPAAPEPGVAVLGLQTGSGALEFIFRERQHRAWELERLCQIAGFGARFSDLVEYVAVASGRTISDGMPPARASVTLDKDNMPLRFSVSFAASALLGDDARCRRQLLRLAANVGWAPVGYPELSARAQQHAGTSAHHCRVHFSVESDGPVTLGFGFRPPG